MNQSQAFPWVKRIAVCIVALFLACGCQSSTLRQPQHEELSDDNHAGHPLCPLLSNGSSRFNVTGSLTLPVNSDSSISLFVAPNPSFETSLYVVGKCPAMMIRPLIRGKNFSFNNLPAGDYIGMVPTHVFSVNITGFPVVEEFNRSNHSLKFNFYGGNWKYSIVSFSIYPSSAGPGTEK